MSDFEIRPATISDALGIATVQYRGWQETYKGIISDSYLNQMSLEKGEERWKKNLQSPLGFIDVMMNNKDEVIAFAAVGKNRTAEINCEGEMYSLYLLKKYQALGLGKQFFLYEVNRLRELGFQSFSVLVLAQNPTVKFYKKFNPDLAISVKTKIAEIEYDEICFGWGDVNKFPS